MLIKIKLKRNKWVNITPENLVDLKEVMCVKDYVVAESWDHTKQYKVEKGQVYRFKRREYKWGSDPKIGQYFEIRELGYWHSFNLHNTDEMECFKGKLINRRKKKNENKVEVKEVSTTENQSL